MSRESTGTEEWKEKDGKKEKESAKAKKDKKKKADGANASGDEQVHTSAKKKPRSAAKTNWQPRGRPSRKRRSDARLRRRGENRRKRKIRLRKMRKNRRKQSKVKLQRPTKADGGRKLGEACPGGGRRMQATWQWRKIRRLQKMVPQAGHPM